MELITNKHPFGDFEELDKLRKQLLNDATSIEIIDMGAGSKKLSTNHRSVGTIVKHGIAPKKQAEFMYRFINHINPATIIELGTSVGLTTSYLAKAAPKATVYTLEGAPELVKYASALLAKQHLKNVNIIAGNFNETFPKLLQQLNTVDVVYVDGNHAYEPTINYFKLALQKKQPHSVFIFDDINWSNGMQRAWKEISAHPEVTLSLDLFFFGIVFFRTEQKNKEHFVLRF